ncbi:MAG: DNA-directed RNA polymerase subunit omega [Acidobacteriota bacterium]
MDKIEKIVDSKFRFVLVAAKRAEQLMQGARPRIDTEATKIARIAMDEVLDSEVTWDYGPAPEEEASQETAEAIPADDSDDEAN